MTPEQFNAALIELEWKGSDFCSRAGLVPNTVWRWRKALAPIPEWADEYLRAMLAIQRLHVEFVAVLRPGPPRVVDTDASTQQLPAQSPDLAQGGATDVTHPSGDG